MNEAVEAGLEVFREVYGDGAAAGCRAAIESGEGVNAVHARWSMEFPFGQLWTREALPRKLRSLAVLGMMIGSRQSEEITYHTKMGVANGLTRAEIEEVFLSSIPYCGFPVANTAKKAILAAFAELDAAEAG